MNTHGMKFIDPFTQHAAILQSGRKKCCISCRFLNGSHLEIPTAEVQQPEAAKLATLLSAAAKSRWESVAAEPNSFAKPVFYLGLNNFTATNMLAPGAHERTGNITLLALGAKGFVNIGERMCFRVQVSSLCEWSQVGCCFPDQEATLPLCCH